MGQVRNFWSKVFGNTPYLFRMVLSLAFSILIASPVQAEVDETACGQGEPWIAIPQQKVVQSLKFEVVDQSLFASWNFQIQVSRVVDPSRTSAKHMALMFIPVNSTQISVLRPDQMDGVGGVVVFKYSMNNQEKPIVDVKIKDGGLYNLFVAGYDCDFQKEQKAGLVRWRLYSEPNGAPVHLTVMPFHGNPDHLASFRLRGSNENLIMYSFPSDLTMKKQPEVFQNGVLVKQLAFSGTETFLPDYMERIATEDLFFLSNSRRYWFGLAPQGANDVISSSAGFRKPSVTDVLDTLSFKRSSPLDNYWAQDFSIRINRILIQNGYAPLSEKLLLMAVLLGGTWLDRGMSFERSLSDYIVREKPTTVSLRKIIELMFESQQGDLAIEPELYFPEQLDGSAFEDGLMKLDLGKNFFRDIDTRTLGDRYYLKVDGPVELFVMKRTGASQKTELVQLEDCLGRDCDFEYGQGPIEPNRIVLNESDIASIQGFGLWIRSNKNNPELSASPDQSKNGYFVEFGKFVQNEYFPLSKISGYLDQRQLVAKPSYIRYHANNEFSKQPEIRFEVNGYSPVNGSVFPVGNSQLLKIARTGLGANGPPAVELSDVGVYGDFAPNNDTDIQPVVQSASQEWAFHFYPKKLSPIENFLDGDPYSAVVAIKADGEARAIVPFVYYPADYLNVFLIGSSAEQEEQKHSQDVGKSLADVFSQEYHLHADWVDLSNWRLGQVFGQTKGISVVQSAQMELASYLQGYPLAASGDKNAVRTALPYGKIYSIGKSDNSKTNGKFSELNSSASGKLILPESFMDSAWVQAAGITEFSPELALGVSIPEFMRDPQFICLTKVNSPGLTCLEPDFVAKIRGALGDPGLLRDADDAFNLAVNPVSDDLHGWNKLGWHIGGGRYSEAFWDLLPFVTAKAKQAPMVIHMAQQVAKNRRTIGASANAAAAIARSVPAAERGLLKNASAYLTSKLQYISEKHHQVPAEVLRQLKTWKRDDLLMLYKGVKGRPNMRSIPKQFHQEWLHGDGTNIGNIGTGGQWNQWWENKIDDAGGQGISKEAFKDIYRESFLEMERQWAAYKKAVKL